MCETGVYTRMFKSIPWNQSKLSSVIKQSTYIYEILWNNKQNKECSDRDGDRDRALEIGIEIDMQKSSKQFCFFKTA